MPSGVSLKPAPQPRRVDAARGELPAHSLLPGAQRRSITQTDSLHIPLVIFCSFLALYLLTLAGAHTFDSLSYIRDMGKPLAALVLPHHLLCEPLVYAFHSLWSLFCWNAVAAIPAQVLCLAGAGGLALYHRLANELGAQARARAVDAQRRTQPAIRREGVT